MPAKARTIHGDDLLYRFLTDLFADDTGAYGQVPQLMLASMGVWLPLDVYRQLPVLLPWVVRDPSCRPRGGSIDDWSSPNSLGYLRDDNSLIKSLPRSLSISSSRQPHLNGARMATEFVAAHVWRTCTDGGDLASRRPSLNSFVPNLVWLPSQVAKLTDREGSTVQVTLQGLAWAIYRNAPVERRLKAVVEESWSLLPEPADTDLPERIDPQELNWFVSTDRFLVTRMQRLNSVVGALDKLARGQVIDTKVVTSRYTAGLPSISPSARAALRDYLVRFAVAREEHHGLPGIGGRDSCPVTES